MSDGESGRFDGLAALERLRAHNSMAAHALDQGKRFNCYEGAGGIGVLGIGPVTNLVVLGEIDDLETGEALATLLNAALASQGKDRNGGEG